MAREFRKTSTPAEEKLWQLLRKKQILKYKFRRQYVVAGFILDFYCPLLRIGIEVDGGIHDDPQVATYDRRRECIITQHRITILRIRNEEIENNILDVMKKIKTHCKNITETYFL